MLRVSVLLLLLGLGGVAALGEWPPSARLSEDGTELQLQWHGLTMLLERARDVLAEGWTVRVDGEDVGPLDSGLDHWVSSREHEWMAAATIERESRQLLAASLWWPGGDEEVSVWDVDQSEAERAGEEAGLTCTEDTGGTVEVETRAESGGHERENVNAVCVLDPQRRNIPLVLSASADFFSPPRTAPEVQAQLETYLAQVPYRKAWIDAANLRPLAKTFDIYTDPALGPDWNTDDTLGPTATLVAYADYYEGENFTETSHAAGQLWVGDRAASWGSAGGIAYLDTLCEQRSVSVVRRKTAPSVVGSHELAHNLGVRHDKEAGGGGCPHCTGDCFAGCCTSFIMNGVIVPEAVSFSQCSHSELCKARLEFVDCLPAPAGRPMPELLLLGLGLTLTLTLTTLSWVN